MKKLFKFEKKVNETKSDETGQVNELKSQMELLKSENKDLKLQLRESLTEISILRSEIAELKAICHEQNIEEYNLD